MIDAGLEEVLRQFLRGDVPPPGMALKPATFPGLSGTDPGDTSVLVDGDTALTPAQSLIGGLATGSRVMVLFWPPHGAYVVGWISSGEWVDVAFAGGWSNFGGGLQEVQYRRVGNLTHLRGVATGPGAGTMFTLPPGIAKQDDGSGTQEDFVVLSSAVTYSGVSVQTAGDVIFVPGPGATAAYVSLSGISFASTDF